MIQRFHFEIVGKGSNIEFQNIKIQKDRISKLHYKLDKASKRIKSTSSKLDSHQKPERQNRSLA